MTRPIKKELFRIVAAKCLDGRLCGYHGLDQPAGIAADGELVSYCGINFGKPAARCCCVQGKKVQNTETGKDTFICSFYNLADSVWEIVGGGYAPSEANKVLLEAERDISKIREEKLQDD